MSEHRSGPDRTRSDGEQLVEAFRADLAALVNYQNAFIGFVRRRDVKNRYHLGW